MFLSGTDNKEYPNDQENELISAQNNPFLLFGKLLWIANPIIDKTKLMIKAADTTSLRKKYAINCWKIIPIMLTIKILAKAMCLLASVKPMIPKAVIPDSKAT